MNVDSTVAAVSSEVDVAFTLKEEHKTAVAFFGGTVFNCVIKHRGT